MHERTTELDLLALLLKRVLQCNTNVRLIVMSATLQASLFGPYFWQQVRVSSVGAANAMRRPMDCFRFSAA